MGLKIQTFRTAQRGMVLYITVLTVGELLNYTDVDYWGPGNPNGYQRPLKPRRLKAVADYICQDIGVLPTSVLLSVRKKRLDFSAQADAGRAGQWGSLYIDDDTVLWVVDGQHRLYGLKRAIQSNLGDWICEYPIPVTIVEGIDRYTEMSVFNIINTRQKPVPTDIVDQHLSRMFKKEGADLITTKGITDYKRGRIASIVRLLNQLPGPWYKKVKVPDIPGMEKGIVRYHSLVASLTSILEDTWLNARPDDDIAYLLSNYWVALRNMMPQAFKNPQDYRVQSTVGIYALHMLFPSVVNLCVAEGDYSVSTMGHILGYTQMTSTFWLKVHGDEQTQASDMGSIRRLAGHLRAKLPNPGQPE